MFPKHKLTVCNKVCCKIIAALIFLCLPVSQFHVHASLYSWKSKSFIILKRPVHSAQLRENAFLIKMALCRTYSYVHGMFILDGATFFPI